VFAEITTAVSAGKMALDSARAVAKLAGEYDKIDLKLKAIELTTLVTELAQENMDLREEVKGLKSYLEIKDVLISKDNHYWRQLPDGKEDGPFCFRCFDTHRRLNRCHTQAGYTICGQCSIDMSQPRK
jgi:hypothetical protein